MLQLSEAYNSIVQALAEAAPHTKGRPAAGLDEYVDTATPSRSDPSKQSGKSGQ